MNKFCPIIVIILCFSFNSNNLVWGTCAETFIDSPGSYTRKLIYRNHATIGPKIDFTRKDLVSIKRDGIKSIDVFETFHEEISSSKLIVKIPVDQKDFHKIA